MPCGASDKKPTPRHPPTALRGSPQSVAGVFGAKKKPATWGGGRRHECSRFSPGSNYGVSISPFRHAGASAVGRMHRSRRRRGWRRGRGRGRGTAAASDGANLTRLHSRVGGVEGVTRPPASSSRRRVAEGTELARRRNVPILLDGPERARPTGAEAAADGIATAPRDSVAHAGRTASDQRGRPRRAAPDAAAIATPLLGCAKLERESDAKCAVIPASCVDAHERSPWVS